MCRSLSLPCWPAVYKWQGRFSSCNGRFVAWKLMADPVIFHACSASTLTWLMLRPPSALIHHSSGSGLKSIPADVYILKLVVRAVFHVETKGPTLQLLLSITLTIRLCWAPQDKKWHFGMFIILCCLTNFFLLTKMYVTKFQTRTSVATNLLPTTLYTHFHLYSFTRIQVWMH